jgi:hypothetical protein
MRDRRIRHDQTRLRWWAQFEMGLTPAALSCETIYDAAISTHHVWTMQEIAALID